MEVMLRQSVYDLLDCCINPAYARMEKEFISFMRDNSFPVSIEALAAWKGYCKGRNLSASTVNYKLMVAKRLFNRAMEKDKSMTVDQKNRIIAKMAEVKKLKAARPTITNKILTESEMIKFLDEAEKLNPEIALMAEFLWSTGVRVSEMLSIKLSNIKQIKKEVYEIRLIGKGSRERTTCIDSGLYKAIIKFFNPSEYLFQRRDKRPRSRTYVSMFIKRLCSKILDRRNLAAHSFRHSYATNGLEKGRSLQWVSQSLGHSDIQTTSRYYCHISVRPEEIISTVKLNRERNT